MKLLHLFHEIRFLVDQLSDRFALAGFSTQNRLIQWDMQTILTNLINTPFVTEQPFFDNLVSTGDLASILVFSSVLVALGILGMITNFKNFLVTMLAVELMYLGVVTSFIIYGVLCQDTRSAAYGILLLIMAACESAVGLGILIVLYRFGRSITFSAHEELGG